MSYKHQSSQPQPQNPYKSNITIGVITQLTINIKVRYKPRILIFYERIRRTPKTTTRDFEITTSMCMFKFGYFLPLSNFVRDYN